MTILCFIEVFLHFFALSLSEKPHSLSDKPLLIKKIFREHLRDTTVLVKKYFLYSI